MIRDESLAGSLNLEGLCQYKINPTINLCKFPTHPTGPKLPDEECSTFHFFLRRHHCRACGEIFCHACSDYQRTLPELGYNTY